MPKASKADKLLAQTRDNFSRFGADPKLVELDTGSRYEYRYDGTLFATLAIVGECFRIELLATPDTATAIKAFKSPRMAYAAIPKRKNWYSVDVKFDQKDLLESKVNAFVGAIINQLKAE